MPGRRAHRRHVHNRAATRWISTAGRARHRRRRRPCGRTRRHAPQHEADRDRRRGEAREAAEALARELAALPQDCLRNDRLSVLEQEGLAEEHALRIELEHGLRSLGAGALEGAARFASGAGRHGS